MVRYAVPLGNLVVHTSYFEPGDYECNGPHCNLNSFLKRSLTCRKVALQHHAFTICSYRREVASRQTLSMFMVRG